MIFTQMIGGGDQIVDVRGKMRIGEFAFAAAQAGEIETQHGDAVHRQPLGDALGRQDILAAGETMRKQRKGGRFAERQIERRRKLFTFAIGEIEAFAAHGSLACAVAGFDLLMYTDCGRRVPSHDCDLPWYDVINVIGA